MKKRIISLLLCLVMVVSLLPVTAHADSVQEDMTKYAGKCITKIELEASVDHAYAPPRVLPTTAIPYRGRSRWANR